MVCNDQILLESLSHFTVHPTWFIESARLSETQENRAHVHECQKSRLSIDSIRDNLSRIIMLMLYLLINLALILYVVLYRAVTVKSGALAVIARTSGMLMNFNCACVIVLMLKQTILIIRTIKRLRKWIPVDDHIDFHRFVGRVIAILAVVHAIAHVSNFITMNGKRCR
jgi:hypothetical protein